MNENLITGELKGEAQPLKNLSAQKLMYKGLGNIDGRSTITANGESQGAYRAGQSAVSEMGKTGLHGSAKVIEVEDKILELDKSQAAAIETPLLPRFTGFDKTK